MCNKQWYLKQCYNPEKVNTNKCTLQLQEHLYLSDQI